ncbi:ADCY8 [Cordylochernes scorpioides]|uniref:ADCY8 n=1 Tax=Cordylochernes scorpioides TaxID=51811 RepID=A0ABY6LKY2_9ARAC|nr:ADCY8 [Cordylochernes scorpioides]
MRCPLLTRDSLVNSLQLSNGRYRIDSYSCRMVITNMLFQTRNMVKISNCNMHSEEDATGEWTPEIPFENLWRQLHGLRDSIDEEDPPNVRQPASRQVSRQEAIVDDLLEQTIEIENNNKMRKEFSYWFNLAFKSEELEMKVASPVKINVKTRRHLLTVAASSGLGSATKPQHQLWQTEKRPPRDHGRTAAIDSKMDKNSFQAVIKHFFERWSASKIKTEVKEVNGDSAS